MEKWKNDIIVSMDNEFVKFQEYIIPRLDHRMSVCENRLDDVQKRQMELGRKVDNLQTDNMRKRLLRFQEIVTVN